MNVTAYNVHCEEFRKGWDVCWQTQATALTFHIPLLHNEGGTQHMLLYY